MNIITGTIGDVRTVLNVWAEDVEYAEEFFGLTEKLGLEEEVAELIAPTFFSDDNDLIRWPTPRYIPVSLLIGDEIPFDNRTGKGLIIIKS